MLHRAAYKLNPICYVPIHRRAIKVNFPPSILDRKVILTLCTSALADSRFKKSAFGYKRKATAPMDVYALLCTKGSKKKEKMLCFCSQTTPN